MKTPSHVPRDALADLFLRVSSQLEALQPPAKAIDVSQPSDSPVTRLLPSRDRVCEILRMNTRFRPADDATKRVVSPPAANAAAGDARRDSSVSRQDLSPVVAVSVGLPTSPQVLAPVGGRARVFQASDLARAKRSMKRRSVALTSVQASAGAGSSAWDIAQTTQSASSMSGKQALISELVRRTTFSTQHIFHMSRKFKEMAGGARSVISFGEFRQLLSDDVGALLLAIGVDADDAAFQEIARTDLRAISATISASDSFLRRLFATFDGDGDGKIDFREFVVGLNGFVKGSLEDKVDALFEVYQSQSLADAGDASASREPTVAISDLLGLFQGDRQLYQELMRCVDEYFARLELGMESEETIGEEGVAAGREETTSISLDDFVATSLAEPRLLETITRPTSSLVYSEDPVLRERILAFVDAHALGWRAMVELQRRLAVGATTTELRLPPARVLQALAECVGGLETAAQADDAAVNLLLRAYVAKPPSLTSRTATPPAPLVDVAALLQDLAVVLLHPTTQALDADAKARFYFERFDVNRDGLVSRQEFVSAVCAGFAHFGPSLTEVVRVLEDEDADQDGELTKQQYLRAARRSPLILASLYTCL